MSRSKKSLPKLPKLPRTHKLNKRREPFRDIEKDGVTYSFLEEWLLCREQARLSFVEGYTESGMSEALEFGSLFHQCLELVGTTKESHYSSELNRYAKTRLSKVRWTAADKQNFKRLTELTRMMFPLYLQFWKGKKAIEFTDKARWVYREESFSINHKLANGRDIKIRGRWDGVFRDESGRLFLMENKTKSVIDDQGLTSYLPLDLQTNMYCLALREHLGEEPAGVIYNVIRRPKQVFNPDKESLDTYVNRVQDLVVDDAPRYFMRWRVEFAPNDITNWVQRALEPILGAVLLWWDSIKNNPFDPFSLGVNPHHFVNPAGLYTRYGQSRYFDYLTRNTDYGLTRRSE